MRAPFQILAIPYTIEKTIDNTKEKEFEYCVLHRADIDQYQFVAGGGEDDENALEAAVREIEEETGARAVNIIQLTSLAYIPAAVFSETHRQHWSADTYVIPEYAFGYECDKDIRLSEEHDGFEWLKYDEAMAKLTWDSNKTALYELNCRLLAE